MRVSISYTCPVEVVVDLDTGEVDRVVVFDEGVTPGRDGYAQGADTHEPVSAEQAARAFEIAEGAAEWPAWDIGY